MYTITIQQRNFEAEAVIVVPKFMFFFKNICCLPFLLLSMIGIHFS